MLTIRFTRTGRKNQPFFRVVVIDKRRSSKGGRAVEIVGNIDPVKKRKIVNKERVLYWISKGAKPSDTVHNLLVEQKIIDGKKIPVAKIKKSAEAIKAEQEAAKAAVAPKKEEALAPVENSGEVSPASGEANPASVENSSEAKPVVETPQA